MATYQQIFDGDWEPCSKREREMCCDCSLVHHVSYRVKDKRGNILTGVTVEQKVSRDQGRTYAARRRRGIRIEKTK